MHMKQSLSDILGDRAALAISDARKEPHQTIAAVEARECRRAHPRLECPPDLALSRSAVGGCTFLRNLRIRSLHRPADLFLTLLAHLL